jgi:hypothetical protein
MTIIIPNTFADKTGTVRLEDLDENFTQIVADLNTEVTTIQDQVDTSLAGVEAAVDSIEDPIAMGLIFGAEPQVDIGTQLAQIVTTTNSSATGALTGVIPLDNTIPQITEGNQIMSITVTPKSSTSIFEIDIIAHLSVLTTASWITMALFRDSGANAIASTLQTINGNWINCFTMKVFVTSNSITATTFYVRAGSSAQNIYFNAAANVPYMGGTLNSYITVKEWIA